MNPKDFWWKEDQQITVTNPTNETHKFKVHNKAYQLGAGKTAKMPGYIAWVYVYEMAVKLCQADGTFNRWNEEGYRKVYFEKLVAGVDNVIQDVEEQPEPDVSTFDERDLSGTAPIKTDTAVPKPATDSPEDDEEGEDNVETLPDSSKQVKPMQAQPKAQALRGDKPAKV